MLLRPFSVFLAYVFRSEKLTDPDQGIVEKSTIFCVLSFRSGWFDFAETGLDIFAITNGDKSRSTKALNSLKFEELWNFKAVGSICPHPHGQWGQ